MARHRTSRKPYNTYPPGQLLHYEPHPTEPNMLRIYVQTKHRHVIPVDVPHKVLTYAHAHHHQLAWCTTRQQTQLHAYIRKDKQ